MIRFSDVSKVYETRGMRNEVLSHLDFVVEKGDTVGICGANGAGKTTLMRLLGGVELPTTGTVERDMRVSWPLGLSSCFDSHMTGADNARFIARIYQKDEDEVTRYVEDFAQLGLFMDQPVGNYSSGMNSRLAFGISLAVDFDCYLIDEITAVGDMRFRKLCEDRLLEKTRTSALIMTSHQSSTLERYCRRGAVLFGGVLTFYDTIQEAIDVHHGIMLNLPARLPTAA